MPGRPCGTTRRPRGEAGVGELLGIRQVINDSLVVGLARCRRVLGQQRFGLLGVLYGLPHPVDQLVELLALLAEALTNLVLGVVSQRRPGFGAVLRSSCWVNASWCSSSCALARASRSVPRRTDRTRTCAVPRGGLPAPGPRGRLR